MEKEVEVLYDREDGGVAWFPAVIHENLGNGMYLVKHCREKDHLETENQQIKVDSLHIRPRPPLLNDKSFVSMGKVDAYFDSGWWSGLILRELENSKYLVAFEQLNMEKMFDPSELRRHMEWKDGKWFTSPQDVTIPSTGGGMDKHNTSENFSASVPAFPVCNFGDRGIAVVKKASPSTTLGIDPVKQLTPDLQEAPCVTPLTKRRRQPSDSRNSLSECQRILRKGHVLVEKQKGTCDMTSQEMLSGSVSLIPKNNVETPDKQNGTRDLSSDNPSWGKRSQRGKDVADKINSLPSGVKNSRAQTSEVENLQTDVGGRKTDVVDSTVKNDQNECILVIGLPCVEMVNSELGKSGCKTNHSANSKDNTNNEEKQNLHEPTTQKIEEIKLLEFGGLSERRKRGRPPKTLQSVQTPVTGLDNSEKIAQDGSPSEKRKRGRPPKTPVADDSNTKDDDSKRISEVEAIGTDNSEKIALDGSTSDPMTKKTSARKHAKKFVKELMQLEKSVSKSGKRRSTISHQVEDSIDESIGKLAEVNSALGVNNVYSTEAPNNELDNQPLSKWIEGMRIQSPSADDRSKLCAAIAFEQSVENCEKRGEVAAVHEEATETTEETPEQKKLPFTKTSLLWKTMDSLDALRLLPQNPHFEPLERVREGVREGLAIGHMVNFCSVVEATCKLQFDYVKSAVDDILEMVAELEEHGFDVGVVKARLLNLVAVKDKEEELGVRVTELECRISGEQREKWEMDKEIGKVKEELVKLQEKQSQLESARVKKEDEIIAAGMQLREMEESMKNLRLEFDNMAAAALSVAPTPSPPLC